MATTATPARTNGQRTSAEIRPQAVRGPGRHRQIPLVVVGVLLVLGCALAFTDASLHLGSREEVLVVAQPVSAGHVVVAGDLRMARVSTGGGLDVVLAGEEQSVIGHRAAVPMVPGSLLTSGEIGNAPMVGSGSDVVAVGLKAGAYPPDLAPGDRVQVIPVTSSSGSSGSAATSGSPVAATVLAVDPASADSDSPTVLSLQVSAGNAAEVASLAAAGQASLIEIGVGG